MESASSRPTHVRWWIFLLACAVSWLLYLHRYSWGVIKPSLLAENPELRAHVGWLDSAFMLTYAVFQVPCGFLGDRFGPRSILSGFILLWSVAVLGVGWTTGFWRLFGLRAFFGFAQAGAYPILSKVTRNWFPLANRTSVQGIVTALGRIGAASCPVILATLLIGTLGFSWQNALLILGMPGIFLALAFWILARDNPREHPWTNLGEQELVDPGVSSRPPGTKARLVINRATLLSLGMMLLYAFASTIQDQLYVNWISDFLVNGRGLSQGEMGLFTPLPLLGGAVGGILGGFLNDWLIRALGNRRWARSLVGFTGKLIASVLIFLSVQLADGRVAMVILLTARIFGDWSLPTQWGAITDMGGRGAATLFGLVNGVGAVGGFVAGPALNWLLIQHGWEGLFTGVAAMSLLAGLTWLFIDCTQKIVADE